MKPACNVATLIERFFTERLMRQRNVSGNTIASYRDTFRLLFMFAQVRLRKSLSAHTERASRQATGALSDASRDRGGSRRARSNNVAGATITPCCWSRLKQAYASQS
ncbi:MULTISPECIES: hypothetical protein [unclassified Bradyrhizobium]|uniref:hypothetical protein n=1 Tax=unclassified Bradyrhizobium TaxID=2631580 RepID=UPI002478342E|nr:MULTISPECIES: hypothetical protein [unclassified Bradyrhizobium]WGS19154.1 hypothetical protein MTX22_32545 [Bradyrhizobium sp. ISRA463]WGS25991.1 hypothetical protein MTX19_30090 [Bradyrhizobium sp. ISRA464]